MTVGAALDMLRAEAPLHPIPDEDLRGQMSRFGIATQGAVLGLRVPQIRAVARRIGRDQVLAEALWETGVHEARHLAGMVGDPGKISAETMDRWVSDFDSWDVCDGCASNLFDRTPHAWAKIREWAADDREFVRRAAFAMIAVACVHDKSAPDSLFLDALPLLEQYAYDNRNFVRKAVNWALRNIGKRNPALRKAAIECAVRIREQNLPSARWIAADALREFRKLPIEKKRFGRELCTGI